MEGALVQLLPRASARASEPSNRSKQAMLGSEPSIVPFTLACLGEAGSAAAAVNWCEAVHTSRDALLGLRGASLPVAANRLLPVSTLW